MGNSIGPDCSTATGIQQFIRDRVTEIKNEETTLDERELRPRERAVEELLAIDTVIVYDIGKMIDAMYMENQERAHQQAIHLQDAGLTISDVKERYEF